MQVKEIELNKFGSLISKKFYNVDSNNKVLEVKVDDCFPNGFSDEIDFNELVSIGHDYVVERSSVSLHRSDPYNRFGKIYNKTFFNKQKQKIRVEEYGHFESFVCVFTYDDDGFLIEENLDDYTSLFGYAQKTYVYQEQYNIRLKKMIKLLKYSKYDNGMEEFFIYSASGDLVVHSYKKLSLKGENIEDKTLYTYNHDGNWISKNCYNNGELTTNCTREFGIFSQATFDGESLPF